MIFFLIAFTRYVLIKKQLSMNLNIKSHQNHYRSMIHDQIYLFSLKLDFENSITQLTVFVQQKKFFNKFSHLSFAKRICERRVGNINNWEYKRLRICERCRFITFLMAVRLIQRWGDFNSAVVRGVNNSHSDRTPRVQR